MTRWLLLLGLLLPPLLTGCKVGPDYRRPKVPTPDAWRNQAATQESIANLAWWQVFRDPVLTGLISVALSNNYDVRIAVARVEQAWGGYRFQRSSLFPEINAQGVWTRARFGNVPPLADVTGNEFSLLGLLSYEVDVWGRLRRLTESARAQFLAAEATQRAVAITLIGSVASGYFDLLSLDEQLRISQRTLASREASLELTRIKFDNGRGIVSELDIRQAETLLYGAQAATIAFERLIALQENALSLLMGVNPGPIPRGQSLNGYELLDAVPAGLPSDLLLRRPDILAAEQQLIAANADIGAARAAYFPTISLTAALGLQSLELSDLFDPAVSKAWNFAPQFVAPIFNAGRISAGVQIATARQVEALNLYGQSIQSGFREVEDALVSVYKLNEQIRAREKDVEAEQARLDLSMLRYEAGVSSYSDVLDAQRFLFEAELALADLRGTHLKAIVQLYRSLGGGWEYGMPLDPGPPPAAQRP